MATGTGNVLILIYRGLKSADVSHISDPEIWEESSIM